MKNKLIGISVALVILAVPALIVYIMGYNFFIGLFCSVFGSVLISLADGLVKAVANQKR